MKISTSYIHTLIITCLFSIFSCSAVTQEQLNHQFLMAAWTGDMTLVRQAIAAGANTANDFALQQVAVTGHLELLIFLLTELPEGQRPNIHASNEYALQMAAECFRWEVVACLLQHGADRTVLNPWDIEAMRDSTKARQYVVSEIHNALANNKLEEIAKLLDIIPFNYLSTQNRTQLKQDFASKIYTALQNGDLSALQQLLNVLPFDYLPKQTQDHIREFVFHRELHGLRARNTKYL